MPKRTDVMGEQPLGLDGLPLTKDECAKTHTPCPDSYRQWHSWAAHMNKTHQSTRCKSCGLWTVWVERKKRTRVETDHAR